MTKRGWKRKIGEPAIEKAKKRLDQAAQHVQKTIKDSLVGPSPSEVGEPPGIFSGNLRNQITWWRKDSKQILRRYIGIKNYKKSAPYALTQEFGHEDPPITHKKAETLAYPISPQAIEHARAGGAPKDFPASMHVERYGSADADPRMPAFLVEDITGIRHYRLLKWVSIPARPYLTPGLKKAMPKVGQIMRGE